MATHLAGGDLRFSEAYQFHRQPNDRDRKGHPQARKDQKVCHVEFGDPVGLIERGMLQKLERAHGGTRWS
jgi:hypothetical protein